jgi:hypothetical protein
MTRSLGPCEQLRMTSRRTPALACHDAARRLQDILMLPTRRARRHLYANVL